MGECDRFKSYISDYLENNLDPTTHQEFENALKSSDELQLMTNRVRILKTHLGNLTRFSCSADFSLNLRERIHSGPQPFFNKQKVVRLALALSVVVVLAITLVSLTSLSNSPGTEIPAQGSTDLKIEESNPISNPVSRSNPVIFKKDNELDVKTKEPEQVTDDSTKINPLPERRKDDPIIKRVDSKE